MKARNQQPADRSAAADTPPPAVERRGTHRVKDDQQGGQGSMSALSKLKMIERKRATLRPDPGPEPE